MKRRNFLKGLLSAPLLVPELKKGLKEPPKSVDGNRWKITQEGNLLPVSDCTVDLGSSSMKFVDDYIYVATGANKWKKVKLSEF